MNKQQFNKQQQQQQVVPPGLELKITGFGQQPQEKRKDQMTMLMEQGINPYQMAYVPNPYMGYGNMTTYNPQLYPIIKNYNISLGNGTGDFVKLHNIYEDILPQSNGIVLKNMTTIHERLSIYRYLRSLFIKRVDGETISIIDPYNNNKDQKQELMNLLSHIKMMEINPYHFSDITSNPYATLPTNFIMFRSCYPIRVVNNNNTKCAPDNIGLNIRIYQMRVIDLMAEQGKLGVDKFKSDLWRDIIYYEFVRETIINKKVSPNFIILHSWYITYKSGIDFVKLENLRKSTNENTTNRNNINDKNYIINQYKTLLNQKHDLNKLHYDKIVLYIHQAMDKNKNQIYYNKPKTNSEIKEQVINDYAELEVYKNTNLSANKCIVALTEAPTINIIDWKSKAYTLNHGPTHTMVQTGFHDDDVWKSIIFQILYGMYVMKQNNIAITNMSLKNIFIKDLAYDENNIGYWKYKIDNIDFYIPNYGHIVIFDSTYNNIENGPQANPITKSAEVHVDAKETLLSPAQTKAPKATTTSSSQTEHPHPHPHSQSQIEHPPPSQSPLIQVTVLKGHKLDNVYKVVGEIFGDEKEVITDTHDVNMNTIFSATSYNNTQGNINLSEEITTLLNNILTKYNSKYSMIGLFIETQNKYLNNRLGTILTEAEKTTLIMESDKIFNNGDIVAKLTSHNTYMWVMYINVKNTEKLVYINSNKQLETEVISNKTNLYRSLGVPEQIYKAGKKISEDTILETYTLSTQNT